MIDISVLQTITRATTETMLNFIYHNYYAAFGYNSFFKNTSDLRIPLLCFYIRILPEDGL